MNPNFDFMTTTISHWTVKMTRRLQRGSASNSIATGTIPRSEARHRACRCRIAPVATSTRSGGLHPTMTIKRLVSRMLLLAVVSLLAVGVVLEPRGARVAGEVRRRLSPA